MRRLLLFPAAAAALLLSAASALAQVDPGYAAIVEQRMNRLEQDIRMLNDTVERQANEIRTLRSQLQALNSDVNLRFQDLESGVSTGSLGGGTTGGGSNGSSGGQVIIGSTNGGSSVGAAPTPEGSQTLGTITAGQAAGVVPRPDQSTSYPADPTEHYNFAYGLLADRDFEGAQRALQAFLEAHPNHQFASNAHYWLGETYYVRGDYENAVIAFATGYRNFPNGSKAPDSLLKLGLSLSQLGRTSDACTALTRVTTDFPNAQTVILDRARREAADLSC